MVVLVLCSDQLKRLTSLLEQSFGAIANLASWAHVSNHARPAKRESRTYSFGMFVESIVESLGIDVDETERTMITLFQHVVNVFMQLSVGSHCRGCEI
jgi:hypothetical protein